MPIGINRALFLVQTDEIFSKFQEADRIKFGPTYKFNIGTNDYDKSRVPSWTDRILYKVKSHRNEVNCLEYNSVLDLDTSDHKVIDQVRNYFRTSWESSLWLTE